MPDAGGNLNRRDLFKWGTALLAGGGPAAAATRQPAGRPPNIVLVLIDDLGWKDLGCYGSSVYETPNIDRLAAEGMRFTDAYSNCPVCSPSRAAILTGQYPARVGFTGHITAIGRHRYPPEGRIIPPDDYLYLRRETVSIAEALKPAGYVSASIGKWHLGGKPYWPEDHGFDLNIAGHHQGSPPSYFFPYKNPKLEWNPDIPNLPGGAPGEYLTDRLSQEAVRFVEQNRSRPFFLYMSQYAVHTPLEAPQTLVEKYERKLGGSGSRERPIYAAMVESMDAGVGRLMQTLQRLDLDRNTVIMFTSDNGGLAQVTDNAPLRAGKGYLYEGGIRVPLIVRWPDRVKPASVCRAPVMGADLYPTVAQIAGERARPGKVVDGRSLVPLLTGRQGWRPRELYWYYPHYSPQAQQPGAALRSDDYKLIEHYDPPGVELYDLGADPGEKTDLAQKAPRKATELRARLQGWLKRTARIPHTMNPNYRPPAPKGSGAARLP